MDNHFGGVIWTNHAISRMRQRGIKQGDAWATWNRPEQSRKGSGASQGAWVYYRTWGNQKIEVVAKQNEKREWIVISVWSDPVYQNNSPIKIESGGQKYSFWKSLMRLISNK
jgi:hypothetical protein